MCSVLYDVCVYVLTTRRICTREHVYIVVGVRQDWVGMEFSSKMEETIFDGGIFHQWSVCHVVA